MADSKSEILAQSMGKVIEGIRARQDFVGIQDAVVSDLKDYAAKNADAKGFFAAALADALNSNV